jgi:hypothetical protein
MIKRLNLLFLALASAALADRGMIALTGPQVSVYEPGQKAIIAWNGKTEVIILSTDIYTAAETRVLGILPLPAEPKISRGDFKSFTFLQQLILSHLPRPKVLVKEGGTRELVPTVGVEVLFHEKLGAHDITTVRAADYENFVRWANEFAAKSGEQGGGAVPFTPAWQEMIKHYLDTGYRYFVFDVVTTQSAVLSREPIVYEFPAKSFYYPLAASSLLPGKTEIQLFTITPEIPDIWSVDLPFEFGSYFTFHGQKKNIIFKIGVDEAKKIAPPVGKLFSQPPYFSCLRYEGPLGDLDRDLVLSEFLKPVTR